MAFECCCCAKEKDFPTQILKNDRKFKIYEEFKSQHVRNLGIKLKVKETGSLLLDPNVTHPFVRIHIVDMQNGMYL